MRYIDVGLSVHAVSHSLHVDFTPYISLGVCSFNVPNIVYNG